MWCDLPRKLILRWQSLCAARLPLCVIAFATTFLQLIGSDTLGRIEGERRGQQKMRWLDGITDSVDLNLG